VEGEEGLRAEIGQGGPRRVRKGGFRQGEKTRKRRELG
jgi:hypothetical protein